MVKIGVLADTHVKDRVIGLHPQVISVFKNAGISLILHAGDVSNPVVIEELSELAPVKAVQGNSDWLLGNHFPMMVDFEIEGVRIVMTHGQGSSSRYLKDRLRSIILGPQKFNYFEEQVQQMMPVDADILIFGHIHTVVNRIQNGKLIFNPGSASIPVYQDRSPSVGILTVDHGLVNGEIVYINRIKMDALTPAMRKYAQVRHWFGWVMPGLSKDNPD